ncbi:MAG: SDR family NAD(P)-dependent oxidoreductase [Gammaproteobacteria bacterium]
MNKLFDLSGRIALVTGAGSGLGRGFALALAEAGATVAVAARRGDRLAETVDTIVAAGGSAAAFSLDVTDRDRLAGVFDAIEARFGIADIVVNNAGIARSGLLADMADTDWDAVIDVNLTAVHRVGAEAARRLLAAKRGGSIINIASILGLRVSAGLGAYIAAKSAVVQLTKAQALEWGPRGIRANAVAPGYFETEINMGYFDTPAGQAMVERIPMRRIGEIDELRGALLLLASDAGSYMNGSIINVDGGHLSSSL